MNKEERDGCLRSLVYEARMLHFAGERCVEHRDKDGLGNCLVEAFLIHARNLMHFLYETNDTRGHRDNVIAEDYMMTGDPSKWCKARGKRNEETYQAIHTRVAHLSTERLSYDKDDDRWDLGKIAADVSCPLRKFASMADLPEDCRRDLTDICDKIDRFVDKAGQPAPDKRWNTLSGASTATVFGVTSCLRPEAH